MYAKLPSRRPGCEYIAGAAPGVITTPDFEESNLMYNINGYMYGNLPGLSMADGSQVRWFAAATLAQRRVTVFDLQPP
jgi:hypothetical protein